MITYVRVVCIDFTPNAPPLEQSTTIFLAARSWYREALQIALQTRPLMYSVPYSAL